MTLTLARALALTSLQRLGYESGSTWLHWALIFIGVIIGGGLLLYACRLAIANFAPAEWQGKLTALLYIVVALLLAVLVFHAAGMI
jgi:hypothetical protein